MWGIHGLLQRCELGKGAYRVVGVWDRQRMVFGRDWSEFSKWGVAGTVGDPMFGTQESLWSFTIRSVFGLLENAGLNTWVFTSVSLDSLRWKHPGVAWHCYLFCKSGYVLQIVFPVPILSPTPISQPQQLGCQQDHFLLITPRQRSGPHSCCCSQLSPPGGSRAASTNLGPTVD